MRVGTLEIQLLADMARLSKDMQQAQRIVGTAMSNIEKAAASARNAIGNVSLGFGVREIIQATDAYTKYTAQLKLSARNAREYAVALSEVRRISTLAQADVGSLGVLYSRITNATRELGLSQVKVTAITENVALALKASGATANEAHSAMLQLSQAFGSGVLRGEEFNAVNEASPRLMKALADGMGVPVAALREMASQGMITIDAMAKALSDPALVTALREQALEVRTVAGAFTVLKNKFVDFIGEANTAGGVTRAFSGAVVLLAENLKLLAEAAIVLGGIKLAAWLSRVVAETRTLIVTKAEAVATTRAAAVAEVEATAAKFSMIRANLALIESERALAVAQLQNATTATARAAAVANLAHLGKMAAASHQSLAVSIVAATDAETKLAALHGSVFKQMGAAMLAFVGGPVGATIIAVTAAIATILNLYDTAANRAKRFSESIQQMTLEQLRAERDRMTTRLAEMEASKFRGFMGQDIAILRSQLGMLDKELSAAEKVVATKAAEAQVARDKEWEKLHATRAEQKAIAIRELEDEYTKRAAAQGLGQDAQLKLAAEFGVKRNEINKQYSKEAVKAQKELDRQREASIKYEKDIVDGINAETDALLKKIEQERFDTAAIGKTKEELALLQSVRYDNVTAMLEQKLATLESVYASEAEIVAIRDQIKARKELKSVWEAQATAQAQDAHRKAWKEMWDSVDKTAHDTFVSILNGGKDTATRLREAFKNGFFDWLYSMTLKKWIINIGATASGVGASSAAVAGGGDVGGSSWLSAGYNLFKTMKLGFDGVAMGFTELAGTISGSLQSIGVAAETAGTVGIAGAYLGAGLAGISLGSMLAGNKSVMGMSGATTSTVGAIAGGVLGGPLGAAIGGALGGAFAGAFGRGPKVSGTTTLAGQFTGAGFTGQYRTPWQQSGGWFSGGRSGWDVAPVAAEQLTAFSALVAGSKSVFDNLAKASGESIAALDGWVFAIDRQVATQDQANQLAIDMADSMGRFLIPSLANFQQKGENLADTAVRMRDTFVATDAILGIVGQTFNQIGFASMQMRANLVDLFGGVQQTNTAMQAYYQAFFTQEEQAVNAWRQMTLALRQLGVDAIPTTNDQFRALVEAQDLNTQSGQQTFAALVGLAPVFDQLTKSTASLQTQTSALAKDLTQLSTTQFATLVDYTRALRLSQQATTSGISSQIAQVIASAPAATTQAVVPFAAATAASPATPAAFSATNPNPANVAAKLAAYQAWQTAEAVAATSNSGAALRKAETARAAYDALPAFAGGGLHTGGLRLVGENGPELEYTGPSQIFSNSQTRSMLDNSGVEAKIDGLRDELRAIGLAIAPSIQKSYKILDRWDGEGMPEVREAA